MYDPRNIRPRDGWVVVLADPRQEKLSSGIYLPTSETGAERVTEGAGEIIRVGPGAKNKTFGLEKGQRVLYRGFLKHANPIETDEQWPDGQKKVYFIMSSLDLLGILKPGIDVGVYSGRPQVPERE